MDEGKAAIEADFVGTHTGEFAGIQPTGRSVRVPYSAVYDLRGDKISGLRIYFPMSLLVEQLTGCASAPAFQVRACSRPDQGGTASGHVEQCCLI